MDETEYVPQHACMQEQQRMVVASGEMRAKTRPPSSSTFIKSTRRQHTVILRWFLVEKDAWI